jgi:hypothetical protein
MRGSRGGLILASILIASAVFSNAAANSTSSAFSRDRLHVPTSPLHVDLEVFGTPYLGNDFELRGSWISAISISDTKITISIPSVFELVQGNPTWAGATFANRTSELRCTARAKQLGDWTIKVEAIGRIGPSFFGSEATLYISVLEKDAKISNKPQAIPTTPELFLETSVPSIENLIRKWTGATHPNPALPNVTRASLPGSLTLTGMFYFYVAKDDSSGQETLSPLKWVTVQVTDALGNYLGGGITGPTAGLSEGRFSVTISNPGTQLRVWVVADTSAGKVIDSGNNVYKAYTVLLGPYSDGTIDVGTYWLQTEPYRAAFRLYESMVWLGWNFLANYANPPKADMTKITVMYPTVTDPTPNKNTNFDPFTNTIHFQDNPEGTKSPDVLLHEYGHAVMWRVYFPYWPLGASGSHWIMTKSSRPLAWTEGWANFYPCLVEADANSRGGYSGTDPIWRPQYVTSTITTNKWDINLETPTWGTTDWENGDEVEGRVAGAMLDFYDNDIDGYDKFSNGFVGIWDVLRNHSLFGVEQNFGDFWNSWKSKGYDQSITGAVGSLYQNTLEYEPRFLIPPSGLTASTASTSQINLVWNDNSVDESDFHIERKTGSGGTWSEITTVTAGTTSYSNTGLSASTTYYYRVRAHRHSDNAYSGYSNEAYATTGVIPPVGATWPLGLPQPTSNYQVPLNYYKGCSRGYGPTSQGGQGFYVIGDEISRSSLTNIPSDMSYVNSYTDRWVVAVVWNQNGDHMQQIPFAPSGTPNAYDRGTITGGSGFKYLLIYATPIWWGYPTELAATVASSSRIDLTWTDNSNGENDFHVERKTGSAGSWVEIGTGSAGVTSFSDSGLASSTTYYYRVRAHRHGDSAYTEYSNEASASIPGPTAQITITSSPTGSGFVKVDGAAITTPQTFTWEVGSTHTIEALSPVSGGTGTQFAWISWSDGGSQSHSYLAPSSSQTVTASYKTQYYLTMQANPTAGGTVSPSSGWRDAGSAVSIQATASTGYSFSSWSGSGTGSYTGSSNPVTITINGQITETASFQVLPVSIMVTSSLTGSGFVTVDGSPITTPETFLWTPGSAHTLAASSPVSGGTGIQYVWVSWSDSGAQSHTITVPSSPTAYTANFKKQYLLTVNPVNPTAGGTLSISTGWQDEGVTVSITATANTGYSFYYWSLDGTNVGSNPSYSVVMNSAHSLTAYFRGSSSISIGLSAGSIALGVSATLSGTITPTQPSPGIPTGTTVTLSYSLDAATWNTFIVTKTGGGGTYSIVWYPPYGKNQIYQIRASWSGDSNYEGSTSPPVSLTVTGDFPRISLLVSGPSSTAAGASVIFDVIVTNPGSAIFTTLYFEVTGPGVYSYFDTQRITVAAGGRGRFQFVWQVSSTASSGQYQILVGLIPPKPTAIAQTLVTIQGLVQPQIAVTPATVARGQTITVTGSGFTTSSTAQVCLGIGGGQVLVFSVNVGSDGQFSLQILIGGNVPVGQRDIRAQDISGNWSNTVLITVTA